MRCLYVIFLLLGGFGTMEVTSHLKGLKGLKGLVKGHSYGSPPAPYAFEKGPYVPSYPAPAKSYGKSIPHEKSKQKAPSAGYGPPVKAPAPYSGEKPKQKTPYKGYGPPVKSVPYLEEKSKQKAPSKGYGPPIKSPVPHPPAPIYQSPSYSQPAPAPVKAYGPPKSHHPPIPTGSIKSASIPTNSNYSIPPAITRPAIVEPVRAPVFPRPVAPQKINPTPPTTISLSWTPVITIKNESPIKETANMRPVDDAEMSTIVYATKATKAKRPYTKPKSIVVPVPITNLPTASMAAMPGYGSPPNPIPALEDSLIEAQKPLVMVNMPPGYGPPPNPIPALEDSVIEAQKTQQPDPYKGSVLPALQPSYAPLSNPMPLLPALISLVGNMPGYGPPPNPIPALEDSLIEIQKTPQTNKPNLYKGSVSPSPKPSVVNMPGYGPPPVLPAPMPLMVNMPGYGPPPNPIPALEDSFIEAQKTHKTKIPDLFKESAPKPPVVNAQSYGPPPNPISAQLLSSPKPSVLKMPVYGVPPNPIPALEDFQIGVQEIVSTTSMPGYGRPNKNPIPALEDSVISISSYPSVPSIAATYESSTPIAVGSLVQDSLYEGVSMETVPVIIPSYATQLALSQIKKYDTSTTVGNKDKTVASYVPATKVPPSVIVYDPQNPSLLEIEVSNPVQRPSLVSSPTVPQLPPHEMPAYPTLLINDGNSVSNPTYESNLNTGLPSNQESVPKYPSGIIGSQNSLTGTIQDAYKPNYGPISGSPVVQNKGKPLQGGLYDIAISPPSTGYINQGYENTPSNQGPDIDPNLSEPLYQPSAGYSSPNLPSQGQPGFQPISSEPQYPPSTGYQSQGYANPSPNQLPTSAPKPTVPPYQSTTNQGSGNVPIPPEPLYQPSLGYQSQGYENTSPNQGPESDPMPPVQIYQQSSSNPGQAYQNPSTVPDPVPLPSEPLYPPPSEYQSQQYESLPPYQVPESVPILSEPINQPPTGYKSQGYENTSTNQGQGSAPIPSVPLYQPPTAYQDFSSNKRPESVPIPSESLYQPYYGYQSQGNENLITNQGPQAPPLYSPSTGYPSQGYENLPPSQGPEIATNPSEQSYQQPSSYPSQGYGNQGPPPSVYQNSPPNRVPESTLIPLEPLNQPSVGYSSQGYENPSPNQGPIPSVPPYQSSSGYQSQGYENSPANQGPVVNPVNIYPSVNPSQEYESSMSDSRPVTYAAPAVEENRPYSSSEDYVDPSSNSPAPSYEQSKPQISSVNSFAEPVIQPIPYNTIPQSIHLVFKGYEPTAADPISANQAGNVFKVVSYSFPKVQEYSPLTPSINLVPILSQPSLSNEKPANQKPTAEYTAVGTDTFPTPQSILPVQEYGPNIPPQNSKPVSSYESPMNPSSDTQSVYEGPSSYPSNAPAVSSYEPPVNTYESTNTQKVTEYGQAPTSSPTVSPYEPPVNTYETTNTQTVTEYGQYLSAPTNPPAVLSYEPSVNTYETTNTQKVTEYGQVSTNPQAVSYEPPVNNYESTNAQKVTEYGQVPSFPTIPPVVSLYEPPVNTYQNTNAQKVTEYGQAPSIQPANTLPQQGPSYDLPINPSYGPLPSIAPVANQVGVQVPSYGKPTFNNSPLENFQPSYPDSIQSGALPSFAPSNPSYGSFPNNVPEVGAGVPSYGQSTNLNNNNPLEGFQPSYPDSVQSGVISNFAQTPTVSNPSYGSFPNNAPVVNQAVYESFQPSYPDSVQSGNFAATPAAYEGSAAQPIQSTGSWVSSFQPPTPYGPQTAVNYEVVPSPPSSPVVPLDFRPSYPDFVGYPQYIPAQDQSYLNNQPNPVLPIQNSPPSYYGVVPEQNNGFPTYPTTEWRPYNYGAQLKSSENVESTDSKMSILSYDPSENRGTPAEIPTAEQSDSQFSAQETVQSYYDSAYYPSQSLRNPDRITYEFVSPNPRRSPFDDNDEQPVDPTQPLSEPKTPQEKRYKPTFYQRNPSNYEESRYSPEQAITEQPPDSPQAIPKQPPVMAETPFTPLNQSPHEPSPDEATTDYYTLNNSPIIASLIKDPSPKYPQESPVPDVPSFEEKYNSYPVQSEEISNPNPIETPEKGEDVPAGIYYTTTKTPTVSDEVYSNAPSVAVESDNYEKDPFNEAIFYPYIYPSPGNGTEKADSNKQVYLNENEKILENPPDVLPASYLSEGNGDRSIVDEILKNTSESTPVVQNKKSTERYNKSLVDSSVQVNATLGYKASKDIPSSNLDVEAGHPTYSQFPPTNFSCSEQKYYGYYADVSSRCQMFHVCLNSRQWSFLCPNGTIFSQDEMVCVWWSSFDCSTAPSYYYLNQNAFNVPLVSGYDDVAKEEVLKIRPSRGAISTSTTALALLVSPEIMSLPVVGKITGSIQWKDSSAGQA